MLFLLAAWGSDVALEVETSGVEITRDTTARIERTLNEVQDYFEHGLGIAYPDTVPVRVHIYGDRDRFKAELKRLGGPDWAGGYFTRVDGVFTAVLWKHESREAMIGVFLHEATHYLFQYAGRTPRWLNEGYAQAFQNAHVAGNVLSVRAPEHYVPYLKRTEPPQAKSVILNPSRWNDLSGSEVAPLYVHGWALTAFLLSTQTGQDTLAAIVKAHKSNGARSSGVTAVENTYRGGMAGLQRDFEQFLSNPPHAVPIPRYREPSAPKADALWQTCADGRLISAKASCE